MSASKRPRPIDRQDEAGVQDDLRLIDAMIVLNGQIDLAGIAQRKGISFGAAFRILSRLRRERLVQTFPCHAIYLTSRGRAIARGL